MFKAIGWVFKTLLFAALVLVVGNILTWRGETISDQIKSGLSHAEPEIMLDRLKGWATSFVDDVKEGGSRRDHLNISTPSRAARDQDSEVKAEVTPSERQKLRDLIQELNKSRGKK